MKCHEQCHHFFIYYWEVKGLDNINKKAALGAAFSGRFTL
ncbi:hypothetical protein D046_6124 [Vibrio parahaemolyticus V-223/04]|nr:hypothetical protein D046_6124 [Vibrio parahaemolyticus V-223/04]